MPATAQPWTFRDPPRWWGLVRHPLMLIASVAALCASVWFLPQTGASISRLGTRVQPKIQRVLPGWLAASPLRGSAGVSRVYLREGDSWRIIESGDASSDMYDRVYRDRVEAVHATCTRVVRRAGWWAPTHELVRVEVVAGGFGPGAEGSAWTVEKQALAREDLLTTLDSLGASWRMAASMARAGQHVDSRVLWWGHAWNVGSLVALALACASAVGQHSYWRGVVRRARQRRGECAACGYDLETITVCPECGWTVHPPALVARST